MSVERLGHLSHAAQVSSCGDSQPLCTPWPAAQPHRALTTLEAQLRAPAAPNHRHCLTAGCQGTSEGRALGWHRQMGAPGHTRGASWGAQHGGPSLPHPLSVPVPSRRCFCGAAEETWWGSSSSSQAQASSPRGGSWLRASQLQREDETGAKRAGITGSRDGAPVAWEGKAGGFLPGSNPSTAAGKGPGLGAGGCQHRGWHREGAAWAG